MRFLAVVLGLLLVPAAWAWAGPGLVVDEAENRLILTDGGTGDEFIVSCPPGKEPSFHFVLNPRKQDKSMKAAQGPATAPASIELRIDDRTFKSKNWQQYWTRTAPEYKTVVALLHMGGDSGERRKFNAEVAAALENGRRMTLKTTLRTKESLTATFDLSGVKEAMDRLRRR